MDDLQEDSDLTISWVSYVLHLVVATSAVVPGLQVGPLLLVVALVLLLLKRRPTSTWCWPKPAPTRWASSRWFARSPVWA